MNLFLSCVSSEFKSYRLKLANHLAAARGGSFEIKVQEDFQQGGFTLLEQLAEYLRGCDAVIHLVGDACGARPEPEHVTALLRSLGETAGDPRPEWSYTQWEYHLARRFGKRTLVYVARPDAPRDREPQATASDDDARLQQAHRDQIFRSGEHYKEFASPTDLTREVFYDLGLNPETVKVNNLPLKTLGSLFKGREEFLRADPAGVRSPGPPRTPASSRRSRRPPPRRPSMAWAASARPARRSSTPIVMPTSSPRSCSSGPIPPPASSRTSPRSAGPWSSTCRRRTHARPRCRSRPSCDGSSSIRAGS